LESVRLSISVGYLGIEIEHAIEIAEEVDILPDAMHHDPDVPDGAHGVPDCSATDVSFCEGFSDTGHAMTVPRSRAGVREATRQEVALAQVVQRAPGATRCALWGLVGVTDAGGGCRVRPAAPW
jgi:hypothetical protein